MNHVNKVSRSRSKRLRKKLYLDEYAMLGFSFQCNLTLKDQIQFDIFLDDLLGLIALRNLVLGGGGDTEHFNAFITSSKRYTSPTNEDISVIKAWLLANNKVSNILVGKLVDANYSF
ncbi:hypothetical protein CWC17_17540 [Pseudoalteromonas sp. S3785]|uniref:YggL 50S ribosome-binding family protein n=1 Tax=Pseudoalteromonas sp. S3785 TaxID=579545 RepID=UPI00110B3D52|nr:50S ribosome-binding protein YggL [Pseudoalteromonas sp. S3785]TMO71041.1 hypothetical protein CWC17_17540 [Pseudoalteromonas sp. S3785]